MSVLTKVFVVLLTVLSIALSMLVVGAFARQEHWKASAEEWQAVAMSEQAKARTLSSNSAIEQQRFLSRHQGDLGRIRGLESELDEKEAEVAEKERGLTETSNQLTVEQASVAQLTEHNKLLQVAYGKEQEFSAKLAKRNSELERRNVDLNDRVKELTVSVTMARSQIRALQQQITAMDEAQIAGTTGLAMATQVPGGPGIVEAGIPSVRPAIVSDVTAPIRGEVTDVRGNLASISVGSADGVIPGMTFLIYRAGGSGGGPQYLGTLRITRLSATESAGRIEQVEGDLRLGDLARDEASFAMGR